MHDDATEQKGHAPADAPGVESDHDVLTSPIKRALGVLELIERAKAGERLTPTQRRECVDYLRNFERGFSTHQLARLFRTSRQRINEDVRTIDDKYYAEHINGSANREVGIRVRSLKRQLDDLDANLREMTRQTQTQAEGVPSRYGPEFLATMKLHAELAGQILDALQAGGEIKPPDVGVTLSVLSVEVIRRYAASRHLDPEKLTRSIEKVRAEIGRLTSAEDMAPATPVDTSETRGDP